MEQKQSNRGLGKWMGTMVGGLVLAGCQPDLPEVQATSRFIEIATDIEEFQVCGGTLARMDAYVERVLAEIDEREVRGRLARYHVVSNLEDYCSFTSGGCAWPEGSVRNQAMPFLFSNRLPLYHEIGHAVHLRTVNSDPPSLFAEGFAMRYENEDGAMSIFGPHDHSIPIDEMLAQFPVESYTDALTFTNALIDVHGMDVYKKVFAAVRRHDSPEQMREKYQAIVGEPMNETEQSYRGVDVCGRRITQCMGATVPWNDDVWTSSAAASCEDSRVVGSVSPEGDNMQMRVTLEISEAGSYQVDVPAGVVGAELVPCQGPCHEGYSVSVTGGESENHHLAAGRYEVVSYFETPATDVGPIRVARSDSGS